MAFFGVTFLVCFFLTLVGVTATAIMAAMEKDSAGKVLMVITLVMVVLMGVDGVVLSLVTIAQSLK